MKLGLINSTWVQAGRDTAFGLCKTRELGFDCVDIFADPLEIDEPERTLIREECERSGLPIISVPCVALGLIDPGASVRRFHVDRVRAHLELAREWGARNVLVVLGEYVWNREILPPGEQWGWAVEAVRSLGQDAERRGLKMVLELEPFPLSLLNDVPKMVRFLDDVGRPNVLANVDLSHLVLAHQPPESLEALRGRIGHVHISDCDGKVHGDLPPGRGVVDFPAYLKVLKGMDVDELTIALELEFAPDPASIVDWVAEAYASTSALMREAGLRE